MLPNEGMRFKEGKEHHYWSLVENRRVDGGRKVVQRHVLYLGEINSSQQATAQPSTLPLGQGDGGTGRIRGGGHFAIGNHRDWAMLKINLRRLMPILLFLTSLLVSRTAPAKCHYDGSGFLRAQGGPVAEANRMRFSSKLWHEPSRLYSYGYRFYDPNLQRWINRDPIGEAGGMNLYGFVGNNGINLFDPYGLSELSEAQYRAKAAALIDSGVVDPDAIFKGLIDYYFQNDKETDWFWDCQDDMEEIFDALGDVLATNFKNQPHGSPSETQDAKRFRKVRNWVESVHYDFSSKPIKLVRVTPSKNPTGKFNNRMDAVMHFYAGGAIAANVGETLADLASWGVEVSDEVKNWFGSTGGPYSSFDLDWGLRGSELQNAFDVSDCKCRKLARKFQSGTFTPSNWQGWYGKPGSVLY
jgi:RHS repeat-associated protein